MQLANISKKIYPFDEVPSKTKLQCIYFHPSKSCKLSLTMMPAILPHPGAIAVLANT
jgi:hypothetical protein